HNPQGDWDRFFPNHFLPIQGSVSYIFLVLSLFKNTRKKQKLPNEMKIKKYKGYFHDELKEIYSRQEREALYKRWMTAVLNLSSLALVLEEERELTPEEYELLTAGLERLKKQEPLQY